MRQLLPYGNVIYDANCLVYYCLVFEEKNSRGKSIQFFGPDTRRARQITDQLRFGGKIIYTLGSAWTEVKSVLVTKALQRMLEEGEIQRRLNIPQAVAPVLRLRIANALKAEAEKLSKEQWFVVNLSFRPASEKMEQVRQMYIAFALDPEKQKRIPPYKYIPSDVDISLVLFSGDLRAPLLTNDRELYEFDPELRERGFCEMVRSFRGVSFLPPGAT